MTDAEHRALTNQIAAARDIHDLRAIETCHALTPDLQALIAKRVAEMKNASR